MRLQKIENLKERKLWNNTDFIENSFCCSTTINPKDPAFGVNVFAVGIACDGRKKKPAYERLCDLTTSHISSGGWRCTDYVVTLTTKHTSCKLHETTVPKDEFILGFIRLDSGLLNNAPLIRFLDIGKITGDFANSHLLSAKGIVPSQPFGRLLRGGKLIALIATSNELRNHFNKMWNTNVAIFYTTSLYGTSKSSSQYDQLNRFISYIGTTTGKFPLRIKEPHKKQIIEWMDRRGISRYDFIFSGSNKADRSHEAIVRFVGRCLRKHSSDPHIRKLLKMYVSEMNSWKNGRTECKRSYLSTYGFDDWRDNLISHEIESKPKYSLDHLLNYWKKKVFKEKAWSLRSCNWMNSPIDLTYHLIDKDLQNPNFVQVR